ncbi:MAG: GNAT family N-acetyltransferase [Pyrinomonadaceae bacterium]|nr:GNAT family N-acetyltransferase [Pyrinomonadaceae bacterium]
MTVKQNNFEWGEKLPRLESERLLLTQMSEDDSSQVLAIFSDPEVMRYWGMAPLKDADDAIRFIRETNKSFTERELFGWGVRLKETGKLIGTCTLLNFDAQNKRAEIGSAVIRKHWGKGVATEAAATLISFAFDTLKLHRLEADVDPKNTASLRVLEKFGFKKEGLLRERWHQMGEIQDSVFLGLLRREWNGSGDDETEIG